MAEKNQNLKTVLIIIAGKLAYILIVSVLSQDIKKKLKIQWCIFHLI
jgi:hypothetical protein